MNYDTYFYIMRIAVTIAVIVLPIVAIIIAVALVRIANDLKQLVEKNKKG